MFGRMALYPMPLSGYGKHAGSLHTHFCPMWFCRVKCKRRYKQSRFGNSFIKPEANTTAQEYAEYCNDDNTISSNVRGECMTYLHCQHCQKIEPTEVIFQKCGRCKTVIYCSRDCQVADWSRHKKECKKE
jgi:hypothetical protein